MSQVLHAIRVLRKSPGFTLSALVILTLGIGANTAIFSVVNAVLLRPLPVPHSDALVMIYHVPPAKGFPGVGTFAVSPANYLDWRKQSDVFSSMAIIGARSLRLGGGSQPQAVRTAMTEPDFFTAVQVKPETGRAFTADGC